MFVPYWVLAASSLAIMPPLLYKRVTATDAEPVDGTGDKLDELESKGRSSVQSSNAHPLADGCGT